MRSIFILTITVMSSIVAVLGNSLSPAVNNSTVTPTQTMNLDPFDFNSSDIYRSADAVIDLKIPAGWQKKYNDDFGHYTFTYQARPTLITTVTLEIGSPEEVYSTLTNSDGNLSSSPEKLLDELKQTLQNKDGYIVTDVRNSSIGSLPGYQLVIQGPTFGSNTIFISDIRIANLSSDTLLLATLNSPPSFWDRADPLFTEMLGSLNLQQQLLPSRTPTPTSNAEQLTVTAIWKTQVAGVQELKKGATALAQTMAAQISATATATFSPTK